MSSSSGRDLYREGFLQKAGRRSFQAWRKRWFVLNGTMVKYYPTQDAAEANVLGSIDMAQVQSIVVSRSVKHGFEVSTNGRTYQMSGKTEEERSEWMSVLKRANQIGQKVQQQRSIGGGEQERNGAGVDGSEKQTVSPSSLYDTLREAETAPKGRASSKTNVTTNRGQPSSAAVPIGGKAPGADPGDDAEMMYDIPKLSVSLTDDENAGGAHYKSPRLLSADDDAFQRQMSSSDDELDAVSDADGRRAHAKRFSRRNLSMDSVATVDSADFTEVESEDDAYETLDAIDGDSSSLCPSSDDDFLPPPHSDKGIYAVDELKPLTRDTPKMSAADINNVLAERNCRYSDPDFPAFEALKMVLKIN